ncbi:MAG TPA: signal recognition particle-docking protein FtsY [Clostridiales bacterium]|nr:signal recognition particle-docking protein FtsY [Clostridiales bacterium]
MGFFSKLFSGLKKTKDAIANKINSIFVGELDDDFYEELEYILISSDIGADATEQLITEVKKTAKKSKVKTADEFKQILREAMEDMLNSVEDDEFDYPVLISFVGVNGVGKTTAIGRLAHKFKEDKKSVLMVAGDTFRAAASDQLTEWAKRANVRIVKYTEGADPGAVVFDGISSAKAKHDDVVLVDTAGRLHNKTNLMEELKKISKVIGREWNGDYKNYLVIDATTGQNALSQVEMFNECIGIDGIVLTKLDGTAKGGIVFAIAKEYGIPVKYVGVGEGLDDIVKFDAKEFVEGII